MCSIPVLYRRTERYVLSTTDLQCHHTALEDAMINLSSVSFNQLGSVLRNILYWEVKYSKKFPSVTTEVGGTKGEITETLQPAGYLMF
jgi:hypothetical protein